MAKNKARVGRATDQTTEETMLWNDQQRELWTENK
ncbi:MAG: hypothetical protein AOA65_0239 [Candidatus Bathyarchaeota archaeon BA1]|nr:MAG: hypothetical protein AOA65_0239 [Candidatus Bathyarchaeota archaeon BA1]